MTSKLSSRRIGPWKATLLAAVIATSVVPSKADDHPPQPSFPSTILDVAQSVAAESAYEQRCGVCHNSPEGRMPSRGVIASMAPEAIYTIISTGVMKEHAQGLSDQDRRHLATYLGRNGLSLQKDPAPEANKCSAAAQGAQSSSAGWPYWGHDLEGTRYQPSPGFTAADVPRLKLKWAFAYPGGVASTAPIVANGRLYVASMTGQVFALDSATGCTRWSVNVGAPVKAALSVGLSDNATGLKALVYVTDFGGGVHALDARDGSAVWSTRVIDDPALNSVSGSPLLAEGRLYVPITGMEDTLAANPSYGCCRARGSLVALDAATGSVLWRSYPITEAPQPTGKNAYGVQMFGPAGAGIWTAPTYDSKRHLVYAATGNDYSAPGSDASDAVIAFDPKNGAIRWKMQVFRNDIWILGCDTIPRVNCPSEHGPDLDFASPPMIRALPDGHQLLLIGSKSGIFYALDPDDSGRIVWKVRLSDGDAKGAIMFGPASSEKAVFVTLSNPAGSTTGAPPGGTFALNIPDGKVLWSASPAKPACHWGDSGCTSAQPAPLAAMPGVVFSGAADGHIRAYDTRDGTVRWDYDTGLTFPAVNGVQARGGGIGRGGAALAAGALFLNTGDGYGQAGNALLTFTVDGR